MSASYCFFLSHASQDRDTGRTINKFYERLSERIRLSGGLPGHEVGFLDQSELDLGAPWPDELLEALCNSRAMVCLYSPLYFQSSYSGKEMAIFRQRLDAFARERRLPYPPPLIFPVLLEKLVDPVPSAIANLQYDNDRYPAAYRDLRLRRLLQSNAGRRGAQEVINVLAEDIMRAVREHPLPPLNPRPAIDTVRSLFGESDAADHIPVPIRAAQTPNLVGPGFVRFFFVAGRRDELQALRHKVDFYGPVEGMTWQPYFPQIERYAPVLAQEIATKLNLTSLPQTLDASEADRFMDQLHQAQVNKNIVVLLVDTWSLCLDRYLNLMRNYDGVDLWNTSVLVVWNYDDDETRQAAGTLNSKLNAAFLAKRNRNDPYVFREIGSASEFSENLSDLLAKVQLKIVDITDQIARAEGDVFIPRPIISGTAPR